ncbi:MAG: hypothetical protein J7K35_07830 [Syntrophobacterales bacterium]|nr:hypothetical protein [Syntrophobacterales bacterium]
MSYVVTAKGINRDIVKDLIAETIKSRFGFIEKISYKVDWLSGNGFACIAVKGTQTFAEIMG